LWWFRETTILYTDRMVKGKIYINKSRTIVMCTKIDSSKYFEGVVLYSDIQNDIVGIYSKFMIKEEYTEMEGILTLSNLHIKE